MELVRGLGALPLADGPGVAAIGFFDGVHAGHRAVLGRTVEAARSQGARSIAVTFDRHPKEILAPGEAPRLLTTVERRAELIEECGVDALVVLGFDRDFSLMPAERFAHEVLREGLHADHVVVGRGFRFGFRAAGTVDTLRAAGLTTESVPLEELDGRAVSSTSIREALAAGNLTWPHRALGRRFLLDGDVVTGHGRGRGLGYPTANLRTAPRLLLPGPGIYAGVALLGWRRLRAAIDVGTNPTFGVEPLHVESFLLDFEGELPGQALSIEFWERLRDEVRYESVEDLVAAIEADVERTRTVIPDAALRA